MTGNELIDLMQQSPLRVHVIGTPENGVIAALDLEGRLFKVVNSYVINRVVPSAILNRSNGNAYLNIGGNALWPALKGTCHGYEYGSGEWRVPPAITGAVWEAAELSKNKTVIRAEIDLGKFTKMGSFFLVMGIIGRAFLPLLFGYEADIVSHQIAYMVCLPAYLYIMYYVFREVKSEQ